MGEWVSAAVLIAVVVLLAAGIARQFGQLGPRGVLLDALALLPQWKFFAQRAVGTDEAAFDDFHLLTHGEQGEWQPLFWPDERRWYEFLWHPQQYEHGLLVATMAELAAKPNAPPTARASLILARYALARRKGPLQLALAASRGRGERAVQLVWLSPWYRP